MNMDKNNTKTMLGKSGARIELSFLIKFNLISEYIDLGFFSSFYCIFIVQEKYAIMTMVLTQMALYVNQTILGKMFNKSGARIQHTFAIKFSEDIKYIKWRFFSIFYFLFTILTESAIMRMYHNI